MSKSEELYNLLMTGMEFTRNKAMVFGFSDPHLLVKKLKKEGKRISHREGYQASYVYFMSEDDINFNRNIKK